MKLPPLPVVVNQLNSHIHISNTSNQYQSSYRKFPSTETALLKIHNDILASMDAGKVTALTLLDFSAAYNTIDYTIFLRRLDDWFGFTGKALKWFISYLSGRCQGVKLGDCLSSQVDLTFGVPQRSVLGPLLFTLYTTPLSSMIIGHAILYHLYAADSQLYVSFPSGGGGGDSTTALNGLQSCLASVHYWMLTNKLKLIPDKAEFLLIQNEQQWSKYLSMFSIELFSVKSNPAKTARNLRVIFDTNFTFHSQISAVCSHAFTMCRIYGVFAVTLIWIVQNYLQLLSCPVVSIIAIHFCMV